MPSFSAARLIQHTKDLMQSEEKLCVKVLRTLQQMLLKKAKYGDRVSAQAGDIRGSGRTVGLVVKGALLLPPRATSYARCCCKTTSRTGSPARGGTFRTPWASVSTASPLCASGWPVCPGPGPSFLLLHPMSSPSRESPHSRPGPRLVSNCSHPVPAGQGGGHQAGV